MMILEIGQWLIDTTGKLGPLSIAAAVYFANQRHNKWTSGAVVRNSNLEDQKLRLALIDRRLTVIGHIRSTRDKVGPTMKGSEALGAVLEALREAELVFEDEEQQAISQCLHTVISYQTNYGATFEHLAGPELLEALDSYNKCIERINAVLKRLQSASRISSIAPLAPPER